MENKENNIVQLKENDIESKRIDIKNDENGIKGISFSKKLSLFIAGCFGVYAISLIIGTILILSGLDEDSATNLLELIVYPVLLLAMAAILNLDIVRFAVDFKKWKNVLIGIGIGIFVFFLPIVYTTIVEQFYEFNVNENEEAVRSVITAYPAAAFFIVGIIGPLCEELTYRVGLFGMFAKKKWLAYVISSLVFGFIHFSFTSPNIVDEFVNLPAYLMSGALFAFAYDKFGLPASFTAHALNNMAACIITWIGE